MNVLLKRAPSANLAPFVESVWVMAPPAHGDTLVQMPTVRARIAWELPSEGCLLHRGTLDGSARRIDGPLLCLPHAATRMATFLSSRPRKFVGVEFKPGGLQAFMGGALRELPDALLPLTDAWEAEAVDAATRRLTRALAHSDAQALDVLEAVLLSQRQDGRHVSRPLQTALTALETLSTGDGAITSAATRAAMSGRQFRDVVHAGTGLTPKRYARILRFVRALRGVHHRTADTDTALAAECGYFDQAHFNHEFKSLTGITPTHYRRLHGGTQHPGCPFAALRQRLSTLLPPRRGAAPNADPNALHADTAERRV